MTKEQEEAIGRLHGLLVTDFNYSGHTESGAYWQHSISFRKDHKYYADAIEIVLSMLEEKDKIIDLMAEDIDSSQIECNRYFKDKEEVKQYFEDKAKELLNK